MGAESVCFKIPMNKKIPKSQKSREQSKLLDKIDELRNLGVGGLVQLPQLIVCGSQSSGKSSVLEAISRVRFPAKDNVCTRFATEVILRRNPQARVKVSIEPGSSRTNPDEQEKLRAFSSQSFSATEDLHKLIKEAEECMGIGGSTHFSDDVLKVEISGPEKPELTLVDLPGLYTSFSEEQSKEGLITVLNLAEKIDPKHERTLGIVTHPDRVSPGSDGEDTWIKFIKNEKIQLQLGWHVLQNRKFETRLESDDKRDELEREFFGHGRWASLSREIVGIDSLRRRLSNVLLKHVRHELPNLIHDIQSKIVDHEQTLGKMGTARLSVKEQRGFLVGISSRFGRITHEALNGMYSDDFFGDFGDRRATNDETNDFRRLRAVIREMNENFAEAISIRGCRTIIRQTETVFPFQSPQQQSFNPYMEGWSPTYVTEKALQEQIQEQAVKNRGIELPGNANQVLVGKLFRDQSEPWEELAERHLTDVWSTVNYFVGLVLQHLTDQHTYTSVMSDHIIPEMDKLRASLFEKLKELTSYRKGGHPLPLGRDFLSKIQESRQKRQLSALKKGLGLGGFSLFAKPDAPNKVFDTNDLERAASQLQSSSDQFAAAEIIDQMQAYYDTAIVTFTDNIAILAIENCLLRPLGQIFTGQTIIDMDDAQIKGIAAEPISVELDRNRLNEELSKLKAGRQTLSAFRIDGPSLPPRPAFVSPLASRSETSSQSGHVNKPQQRNSKSGHSQGILASATNREKPKHQDLGTPKNIPILGGSSSDAGKTSPFSDTKPKSADALKMPASVLFSTPQTFSPTPASLGTSVKPTGGLFGSPSPGSFPAPTAYSPVPAPIGTTVKPTGSHFGSPSPGSLSAPTASGNQGIVGRPLFGQPSIPSASSPDGKPQAYLVEKDANTGVLNHYQHMCFERSFGKKSPEEHRLVHYRTQAASGR
ncbi:hypothetical protein N7448_004110 [Penicillium atrosanguineum]|nr:hypothetical protein N7448_004110 [Penicillium atrosanguineum]